MKARYSTRHSHRELEWIDDACDAFVPVVNGRLGDFNAFDVNCGRHNSQAPSIPLIVRMHGPYFDEDGNDFYLFDYNHANEFDDERYRFVP